MKQNTAGKVSDLRMEAADNGLLINYCIKIPKTNTANVYDSCNYDYKKEVFEVASAHEAIERFLELAGMDIPEEAEEKK